ncbi:MAG: hypothetical protein RIQ89_509 [Bacteroidota bacterium]
MTTSVCILLCQIIGNAANTESVFFYRWPLDTIIVPTGSFGEIRSDHLHSGIDLSTFNQIGLPVKAAADGYVSRIKVSASGFGYAIYINHPNNTTSVYAHLDRFNSKINAFVKTNQYKGKKFELDINIDKKQFPIKQNDLLGYSGNSGSSSAPHLHFEIRDQQTEMPLNPKLLGLNYEDSENPEFLSLRVFPALTQGTTNFGNDARFIKIKKSENNYTTVDEKPIEVYGKIGFGVEVNDKLASNTSSLGIHRLALFVDNVLQFSTQIGSFNFEDTRMANALIDYDGKAYFKKTVYRLHQLAGNKLKFNDSTQSGYVDFVDDEWHDITIIASDVNGNNSTLAFRVLSNTFLAGNEFYNPDPELVLIGPNKGLALHKNEFDLIIPNGAVYDNHYLLTNSSKSNNKFYYFIGDKGVALHQPIQLTLHAPINDAVPSNKYCIVNMNDEQHPKYLPTTYDQHGLKAKSKQFGKFTIAVDTTAPSILEMPKVENNYISIIAEDFQTGIANYEASINDEWVLMTYDQKRNLFSIALEDYKKSSSLHLKYSFTDAVGNQISNTATINR